MSDAKTDDTKKSALDRYREVIEEEIFRELGKDADPRTAEKLREKIRARVKTDIEEELEKKISLVKRDLARELTDKKKTEGKVKAEEEVEWFERANLNTRVQHFLLLTSVLLLIFTGLPIKFDDLKWSELAIQLMGGIESVRILHRIGAVILMGISVYHTFYLVLSKQGRYEFIQLLPRPKDLFDLILMLQHFLGKTDEKPRFGRFSYIDKFDYWAVYWGCAVMIGSGLMMWFPEQSMMYLPKFVLDAASEAHSDEALLATLAIIIWHFYNVHFSPDYFPINWVFWTGKVSKREIMEHHPLEYDELMKKRMEEEQTMGKQQ